MPTPDAIALEILAAGARELAGGQGLEPALKALLDPLPDRLGVASAAVFVISPDGLVIAAAIGLADPATLAAAVRNPDHPVARTLVHRSAAFDVLPMAAGGPKLRSHLPLVLGTDGRQEVVGVLALAHDRPLDDRLRLFAAAVADLAAVAVARDAERAGRR